MIQALVNARIFDGEHVLHDQAVLLDGGHISAVLPADELAPATPTVDLGGELLAPGFVDLQLNGGGDLLFNDTPDVDTIAAIGAAHRRFGTTGFLPTLISTDVEVMRRAVAAVVAARAAGVPGVLGIHLEGPFLNPARRGVHDADKFRKIDAAALDLLTTADTGRTLVTLAPELTDLENIRALSDRGVLVWGGHSAADYAQTHAALGAGLAGFTHLFNAMTPLQSREPGMVGAALEHAASYCGIIVDGYHVHPASLRVAIAAKAKGRVCLVTDAMPTVGGKRDNFTLNGDLVYCRDGRCATADDVLAGSALDMALAVRNCINLLGVDWQEALRMASLYPARALGLGAELGMIRATWRANLCLLDDAFQVTRTWIDGVNTG